MAVDYFLTDGARVCPQEFAAFSEASDAAMAFSLKLLDQPLITDAEELQAQHLHAKARELEKVARAAFSAKHPK